jgi:hypothetical protein
MSKLTEADLDAASWVRYPATPLNTGRVLIGSRAQPPQYPPYTSADHDRVQQALLDWKDSSANDSRILGSSRDLHKMRVGKRSPLWRAARVMRELWQWLRSPRAW